ncbi:hypothetical protein [Flavobacterium sp. Arc2]|uniref:hypothetical protein n=1 Tax=Flavobacterium sp. Arc2 TaxID=3046685 RepID=UPI00352CC328
MTEIEILQDLKKKYSDVELNEAETRFKIIDTILNDVLKWPKDPISVEKFINGNRADYVLKGKNNKPLLILESKKNGIYFELPNGTNTKKGFQKILLETLLTNDEIKKAVFQVKEYAEDLQAPFASICNGKVWIIFKLPPTFKPWKKLSAYVINDIDFFINDLTHAINILGYDSVTQKDSLGQNIGVSKKTFPEIYYPKNNITAYNTPVNSNKYAGPLNTLSRKYLGSINETDADFMNSCYVSNKGKYDDLQKDVQGFLHDSLTPYFKNLGFRDFTDDKAGGAFGIRIAETVKRQNLHNVMILFGGRGAGKSTFLKRFLFYIKPREIEMYAHIALIGLLQSSQTRVELTDEIWKKILVEIDVNNLRNGTRADLLELFSEEFEIYKKQILVGLEETNTEYQSLLRQFVLEKTNDIKLFCEKISIKWKDKNKTLIIFLDNMDQLSPDLQDVCFLTSVEIAEKLGCLVIVSMREERYYDAQSRGVLDAYQSPGFHLSSPVIPEVVIKRIDYILEQLKYTTDLDTEFGIKNLNELNTLNAFFNICKNQLKRKNSPLSYFLRYATHGDVRQALEFFKGFLTSGYTNIDEMAPHSDWVFQVHQVIKPMMIPDRFFYDERKSKIPNLYQLRNDIDSSHFTGLRILNALHNRISDKGTNGFIDAKFLIQNFDLKYDSKNDCINHIDLYLEKGLIESSNRLEHYSEAVDHIKLTALGNYIYEYLAFNFAYIDLVCLDSGIFNEELNNYFVKSAEEELKFYYNRDFMSRIEIRINRARRFVHYLNELEQQEFLDLNLDSSEPKFTEKLIESVEDQIQIIRRSSQNKERNTSEYN